MGTLFKIARWLVFAAVLFGLVAVVNQVATHRTERHYSGLKAIMKGVEIAVKSYKAEYLRMPDVVISAAEDIETRGLLLAILTAEESASSQNPKRIRFFDPPPHKANGSGGFKNASGEWELRDNWGHFYRVRIDVDGDGMIPNPHPARGRDENEPEFISTDVLLYSAGPDGAFSTWKDNVCSWK